MRIAARRSGLRLSLLGMLLHVPSSRVFADGADLAQAEDLFRRGKDALAAGDTAQACSQLAESYRLDAATGTLLALALCHERQGELMTAIDEYKDAVVRARAQSQRSRERAARDKIEALERQVPTLTIAVPAEETPELQIRVDGATLDQARLEEPVRVDPGDVLVEVSAPGRQPWQTSITLAAGDAQTVTVPVLEPLEPELPFLWVGPVSPAPTAPEPATPKPPPATPTARRWSAAHWTGMALMGAGGAGLAVGFGFTLSAIRKDAASDAGCIDDLCTPDARDDRLAARDAGRAASVALAAGAVLGSAGLITYLLGRRREAAPAAPRSPSIAAAPWAAPHGYGAALMGRF